LTLPGHEEKGAAARAHSAPSGKENVTSASEGEEKVRVAFQKEKRGGGEIRYSPEEP